MITKQDAQNLLKLLERVQVSGAEAITLVTLMSKLAKIEDEEKPKK